MCSGIRATLIHISNRLKIQKHILLTAVLYTANGSVVHELDSSLYCNVCRNFFRTQIKSKLCQIVFEVCMKSVYAVS